MSAPRTAGTSFRLLATTTHGAPSLAVLGAAKTVHANAIWGSSPPKAG